MIESEEMNESEEVKKESSISKGDVTSVVSQAISQRRTAHSGELWKRGKGQYNVTLRPFLFLAEYTDRPRMDIAPKKESHVPTFQGESPRIKSYQMVMIKDETRACVCQ